MPTCVDCGRWSSPSEAERVCPRCGGELRWGLRVDAAAAAAGLTREEYLARRELERDARRATWIAEQERKRAVATAASEQRAREEELRAREEQLRARQAEEAVVQRAREGHLLWDPARVPAVFRLVCGSLLIAGAIAIAPSVLSYAPDCVAPDSAVGICVGPFTVTWAAIAAFVVGGLGGAALAAVLYGGGIGLLDELASGAPESRSVRRFATLAGPVVLLGTVALAPLLTLALILALA